MDAHCLLKIIVAETELIAALRQVAFGGVEKERTSRFISKAVRKGSVSGWFDPRSRSFCFSAVFYRDFKVYFRLKRQSTSYVQFLGALADGVELLGKMPQFTRLPHASLLSQSLAEVIKAEIQETPATRALQVHPQDFEVVDENDAEWEYIAETGKDILPEPVALGYREFRVYDREGEEAKTIPALLFLQLEEISELELPEPDEEEALSFSFLSVPKAEAAGNGIILEVIARGRRSDFELGEFCFHWGSYESGESWSDVQAARRDMRIEEDGTAVIRTLISPRKAGDYGATCWFRAPSGKIKVWCGRPMKDDASFHVEEPFLPELQCPLHEDGRRLKQKLEEGFASFKRFVSTLNSASKDPQSRNIGELLLQITRENGHQETLCEYYQQAAEALEATRSSRSKKKLKLALESIENLGLGELVFVAPEGHHAIGGGLAQVVIGLTKALEEYNIASTLITPLYERANGRKHKSAETLLKDGLAIHGGKVPLRHIGEIFVHFGPTYYSGTERAREFPRDVPVDVYLAETGRLRIYFLRQPSLAPALYAQAPSDEQLRRAIFLSRGALELIDSDLFHTGPQVLVTNDWLTGLTHAFLRTDERYLRSCRLQAMHTVHILHNCGRTYQGLFYVNQFGEDLWPLLSLSPEHFFGLCDPADRNYFNLTAAAVFHVEKALLAVSRPYAKELMTKESGEGLDGLIREKRDLVYGISNGVDLAALRLVCWQLGENAREALDFAPLGDEKFTEVRLLKRLASYKEATKLVVQRTHGLKENPDAVLMSFIGRLAEQKGTALLATKMEGENRSVLEAVLSRYPEVQIIIGGPPSEHDPAYQILFRHLQKLTHAFPGRIQGVLDFIPHAEALEITLGSELFLMPSRYEPGGIAQLEALATGTLVVARNVGGISATLLDHSRDPEKGTAFLFEDYTPEALFEAINRAIPVCRDRKRRRRLMNEAASKENDWKNRLPLYLAMLQQINGVFDGLQRCMFLEPRARIVEEVRA